VGLLLITKGVLQVIRINLKSMVGLFLGLTLFTVPLVAFAQTDAPTCDQDYTVQAGDSLTSIALELLGDGSAYPAIVDATNAAAAESDDYDAIDDPAGQTAGAVLCIPAADDLPASTSASPAATITATGTLTETDVMTDRR
jgi:hypothetical protein